MAIRYRFTGLPNVTYISPEHNENIYRYALYSHRIATTYPRALEHKPKQEPDTQVHISLRLRRL